MTATGAVQLRQPKVARARLREVVAALPPCTIGIQACSGAHHWARLFAAHGHTVELMAPKLVAPYRMSGKRGKNDAADAATICEALQRPNMRFVPVKTEEQQSRLMVHRARQGFVAARTDAQRRLYRLRPEPLMELDAWLIPFRRYWSGHVDALERHLDRAHPVPRRKGRKS